jgi:hypothetical protein
MKKQNYINAMEYMFLTIPKVISGKAALSHLPGELTSLDVSRPLLLAGREAEKLDVQALGRSIIRDSETTIGAVIPDLSGYVSVAQVERVVEMYHARGCDSIIAAGSDSVLSTAKAAGLLAADEQTDLAACMRGEAEPGEAVPLVVIPSLGPCTEAGTGMVRFETGSFYARGGSPDLVCIDPKASRFSDNLSRKRTVYATLALTMEAARSEAHSPMVDAWAFSSLRLACEQCHGKKGSDGDLRLFNAALYAGVAWENSTRGPVTRLSSIIARASGRDSETLSAWLLLPWLKSVIDRDGGLRDELLMACRGFGAVASPDDPDRFNRSLEVVRECLGDVEPGVPVTKMQEALNEYIREERPSRDEEKQLRDLFERATGGAK